MLNSFDCSVCGAPMVAEPDAEVMACPYCGSALSIPPRLRRKAKLKAAKKPSKPLDPFSAAASVKLDEKTAERNQRETEMLTNGLRRAQPVALKAARAYQFWVLARHYLPGLLLVVTLACLFACGALLVIGVVLGRANF